MPRFQQGDRVKVSAGPLKGRTGVITSFHLASAPREFGMGGEDADRTMVMYQISFDTQGSSQERDGLVLEEWLQALG